MGGFFRGLKNILDFGGVLPKIAGAFGLPDPLGDMLEEPEGPEAPAAAEEAPTRTDDAAVAKAGADAREEAQRRRGRRATILSSRQDRKKATLGKRGVLGG